MLMHLLPIDQRPKVKHIEKEKPTQTPAWPPVEKSLDLVATVFYQKDTKAVNKSIVFDMRFISNIAPVYFAKECLCTVIC